MKTTKIILILVLMSIVTINCSNENDDQMDSRIDIVLNETEKKVDVNIDGKLFTSFLYTDELNMLKKPVLYPLISANGAIVTRGYPLNPRPKERTDHPHHIGAWLNYGDVNGLDFWNNSDAIAPEKASEMGTIRVLSIDQIKSGMNTGELSVTCEWLNSEGSAILEESTNFIFKAGEGKRVIDILESEPGYYGWIMGAQFPLYTKRTLEKIHKDYKEDKEGDMLSQLKNKSQ